MPDQQDPYVHLTREQYTQLWGEARKGTFSQEVFDRAEQLKLGDELRGIIKKTHPNVPQHGFDERKYVDDKLDAWSKEQKDKEKAAADKSEDDAWNRRMANVREEHRYTDDEMKNLDSFMRTEKIANPEAAAREMNRRSPRMSEPGNGQYFNITKTDGWDEIAKNPEKWAHDQIYRAAKKQEETERNRRF
jgi:hypothetical protein